MYVEEQLQNDKFTPGIKENSIHVLNMKRQNILNADIGEVEGTGFEARMKNQRRMVEMLRKKISDDKEVIFVTNFINTGKN